MAVLQIPIKPEDKERFLAGRPGRKKVADMIVAAVLNDFQTTRKPGSKVRWSITVPDPIKVRLEEKSQRSGVSVAEIVREILGFDY